MTRSLPTLNRSLIDEDIEYFGVRFATPYVLRAAMETGIFGIVGWPTDALMALVKGEVADFKGENRHACP